MPKTVLEVKNLSKTYGSFTAVDGISFSVPRGKIVGFLGPNGAGKTSTISMILGILEPSGGSVTINGHDVARDRTKALESTNFAAVYSQLPGNLTIRQNLHVFARLYGVRDAAHIENVMRDMDVDGFGDTKAGALSSGEQTRVALAKAMLNDPALLLLDEPTASLDPSSAQLVREKIRGFAARGTAVLWTSHNMQEVTEVCDRVFFLSHGKILLEGDPKTLPAAHGKKDLEELFITVAREPLSLDI